MLWGHEHVVIQIAKLVLLPEHERVFDVVLGKGELDLRLLGGGVLVGGGYLLRVLFVLEQTVLEVFIAFLALGFLSDGVFSLESLELACELHQA